MSEPMVHGVSDGESTRLACDLVMKGGITSGVAYPRAVVALHDKYRLCSIGGASAGAIAAGASAAAEYGDGHGGGGFASLNQLGEKIAADGLLAKLFQAARPMRAAFDVFQRVQKADGAAKKIATGILRTVQRLWMWVIGAVVLASLGTWAVVESFGGGISNPGVGAVIALIVILFVAAAAGVIVGTGRALVVMWTKHLPGNFYGVCSGMPAGRRTEPALTPWLHAQIQECAGLPDDDPLTFGHLEQRSIRLQLMTTDLTLARPVRVPFRPSDGVDDYLFSLDEFRRLFPEPVIDFLERSTEPVVEKSERSPELRFLPHRDLPVIVAVRMSLSFPVLLSAVPLWTLLDSRMSPVDQANMTAEDLFPVQHWFSDGGIGSNFPIHFFDRWLPARPTLGISLRPSLRSDQRFAKSPEFCVLDPSADVVPPAAVIKTQAQFLHQILDTMQNWRDTLQAELPGFHDRIRTVLLARGEGGMNLTMPKEAIERVLEKGRLAGQALATGFQWEEHREDRYSTLMRLLQQNVWGEEVTGGPCAVGSSMRDGFRGGLAELLRAKHRVREADVTGELLELFERTWREELFTKGADPVPTPVMRVTPAV